MMMMMMMMEIKMVMEKDDDNNGNVIEMIEMILFVHQHFPIILFNPQEITYHYQ